MGLRARARALVDEAEGSPSLDVELAALQVWDGAAWSERAPMPRARMDAACAAVGGRLVVLGGWVCGEGTTASVGAYETLGDDAEPPSLSGTTASVIAYDPAADAWSDALAPLPAPRAYFAAAADGDGRVVVVGDGPPLRFDSGEWHELPALPYKGSQGCVTGSILLG